MTGFLGLKGPLELSVSVHVCALISFTVIYIVTFSILELNWFETICNISNVNQDKQWINPLIIKSFFFFFCFLAFSYFISAPCLTKAILITCPCSLTRDPLWKVCLCHSGLCFTTLAFWVNSSLKPQSDQTLSLSRNLQDSGLVHGDEHSTMQIWL